jgi:Protein of unknown function (DUF3180)
VKRTSAGLLVAIAAVTGVCIWAIFRITSTRSGIVPAVAWTTPATFALIDLAMLVTVLTYRPRLLHRPGTEPVPPLMAGRLVALALATSRAAAALVGVYLGWAAAMIPSLATSFGRQRAIYAVITAALAGVLMALGLILERACRLPAAPDDEDESTQNSRGD